MRRIKLGVTTSYTVYDNIYSELWQHLMRTLPTLYTLCVYVCVCMYIYINTFLQHINVNGLMLRKYVLFYSTTQPVFFYK